MFVGVRFIFLHTPLLNPQGQREGVGERVDARNSSSQDDERVSPPGPQPEVRWQRGQMGGTAQTAVLPKTPGSKRRESAAGGSLLAADLCEALVDELPMSSTSGSTADCRPRCVAPTWD